MRYGFRERITPEKAAARSKEEPDARPLFTPGAALREDEPEAKIWEGGKRSSECGDDRD